MSSLSSLSVARRKTVLTTRAVCQSSVAIRTNTTSTVGSCPMDDIANTTTIARPFNEIPGPKGIYNLPYLGFMFHMKPFGKYTTSSVHLLFNEMIDRYGPIFKIRTDKPTVIITEPADRTTLLQNEGRYPVRPNFDILNKYYERTGHKPDLASLHGQEWLKMRIPIQKIIMRPKIVSNYLPELNGVADQFVHMMTSGYLDTHNTEKTLMAYMAELAGTILFNKRLGLLWDSENNKIFMESINNLTEIIQRSIVGSSFMYKFFKDKEYMTFETSRNYVNQKIREYIQEEIKTRQRMSMFCEPDKPNVLHSLLQVTDEEEASCVMEALFTGAIDSSAAILQIIFHTLAKHPDKQEILRQEIYNTIGFDQPLTEDALNNMPYLKACVTEAYRYSSPLITGTFRKMPVDVVLGGYKIPAGTHILIYALKAVRDPKIFPEPDKYLPERWLRTSDGGGGGGGGTQRVNDINDARWSVLPFGIGARTCVGKRIFEQEIYLTLAKMVQKLQIGLKPDSENVDFEYRLFWKPKKNLNFSFTPLNRHHHK